MIRWIVTVAALSLRQALDISDESGIFLASFSRRSDYPMTPASSDNTGPQVDET
jgi:hypothetical protein